MDFNLTPNPVYARSEVLSASAEVPVDIDFTLPDYCSDVEKIFKCIVEPQIFSTSCIGGQITVDGASVVRVLYTSSDKKILRCAEQTVPFTSAFPVNTPEGECFTQVRAKCEYINCRAVSPRRLMIHGALSVFAEACEKKAVDILCAQDADTLQTMTENVNVCQLQNICSEVFSVAESIAPSDKAPVTTILRSELKASVTDCTPVGNRLMLKGELTLCLLYNSELKPDTPEQLTYVFPFVHNTEAKNADDSTLQIPLVSVLSYDIKLKTEAMSDVSVIVLDAKLGLFVSFHKDTQISYIRDAYSTACDTQTLYSDFSLKNTVEPKSLNIMSKSSVKMGDVPVVRIVDIFCDNISITPRISDKINLLGKANFCIIAKDDKDELLYFERNMEIEHSFDNDKAFNKASDVSAFLKSVSFRLSDNNELELRAEIKSTLKLEKTADIRCVSQVVDCGELSKAEDEALVLYFAQKGESVWDIAKRYRTDKGVLCKENCIDEGELDTNRLLLIPTV